MPGENEQAKGQMEAKDEFGDAFEEASQEKTPEELEAEALEKERAEREEVETHEEKPPEGQTGTELGAGKEKTNEGGDPDYKKLYEEEHQRYSSLQGMYNQTQEEIGQLKKTAQPPAKGEHETNEGEISADDLLKALDLEGDDDVKLMLDEYDYLAKPLNKIVARAMNLQKTGKQPTAEELTKQVLDMVGQQVHDKTIKTAHPDFDSLAKSGELKAFVEGLPDGEDKTLLTGYYNHGTADEVISLVDTYKETKGIRQPQAGNDRTTKLRNLAAVPRRHTPVDVTKKTGKAQSFDDAFDEAVGGRR
jgi:hypothetical protein